MQPVDVMIELRNIFSTIKAQRIIPVLRRDPLLWSALQDDAYFRKLVGFAGDEPEKWSPAFMALVAIVDKADSRATMKALVEAAQKKSGDAARLLDETRQMVRQPKNLIEAGNLALALRQRFITEEPSRTLLQEIMPLPGEAERPAMLIWQTPLACLLGMVSEPLDVLRALLPKRISILAQQWACHAVFSNPYDNEKKSAVFTSLLTGLPPAQQLSWLRQINLTEPGDLVESIARKLLAKTSISSAQLLSKTNLDMIDIETAIVRCLELQRLAGLYRFANQPANAKVMLQKAQSIVQHWLAGLGIQDADLASLEGQPAAAMAALHSSLTLGGGSNGMQSEVLLSVEETGQAESLVEQLSDQSTNPVSQIFLASRIYRAGETEFAREMASRAIELWLQQIGRQALPFTSQFMIEWHPESLIQALLDMKLPHQAISIALQLQEIRPADPQMNELLSRIYDELGDTRQALVYGQFAVGIAPDKAETHSWLSNLWGKLGNWSLSYQEQHQAIFLMKQPAAEDWTRLARCAVMLKDWKQVEESCDQALSLNPDYGSALAMKGQSYLETGQLDEAGKMLSRATLLAPEEAETWLQLARLYQRINNPQRAMETLRAAVLAVPTSAEVNFALARACLENGLTSDALPFLRKAASLNPGSIDIAVDLGETLCVLGHVEEALQLLEQAREKWPQHARLAYTHAQAALSAGNRDIALQAMEVALESDAPIFEWYIQFARIILGKDLYRPTISKSEYSWAIKAERALEKALKIHPEDYEPRLLMAEVIQRKGEYPQAYQMFQELMERIEFHSAEFRWRVQAGLGQVALRLEHYDSALASLQEAVLDQPENIFLQHLLTEAYSFSHLDKQALSTARYALKLAPDDLDNLSWYAEIMTHLGQPLEAIQALRTATQLAPELPGNWLKLAELHFQMEDVEAGRANLNRLLGLSRLDRESLHRAATLFLALNDPDAILECLAKIAQPDPIEQIEIAYFAMETNNLDIGLKAVQNAAQHAPEETAIYVVESEVLNQLNRKDASLACLEHALHLSENKTASKTEVNPDKWMNAKSRGLVPPDWLDFVQTQEAIHDHLAKLFQQMGDYNSAFHHAELALDLLPSSYQIRLQAANISASLLMNERYEKILAGSGLPERKEGENIKPVEAAALAQLLTMRAELNFECGKLDESHSLLSLANEWDPSQERELALQARLSAREGDWKSAVEFLNRCSNSQEIWMAKAALELFDWDLGLSALESLSSQRPSDLNAQYWLARGLATAALARKTGLLLALSKRLPGDHILNGEAVEQFERASSAAQKSSNRIVDHWQAIGRAIFQPSLQTIRALAAILPGESEAAALVAVLREIANLAGAIQVAEQYQDNSEVLLQLALCYIDQDISRGVEVAAKAATLAPYSPICKALLAKLNQREGRNDNALALIEEALTQWPDEPEWHVWASQMAENEGLGLEVIKHWEKALENAPRHNSFAIPAAKAFLIYHEEQKAIRVLESASAEDPYRMEIWYLLGKAYNQIGQAKSALNCAEKAGQIEPRSLEPALLCGEIHLNTGHLNEALEWAQKAISLDGRNPSAVIFLATVLTRRQNLAEALNVIERAIQQNVMSEDLVFTRVNLIYRLHGAQVALPQLIGLKNLYPDNPSILKLLAQAEMEVGNFEAAQEFAVQALQIDPEQPEMNLLMGKLERIAGQLDQSIYYLSKTIQSAPNLTDAFLELGQAYLDRREPIQALLVYQKAMKAIPQDYRSFYQSGLILRESKDYHGAETMLRRAAELSPDDLNIRRQLGAVITLNLIHSSQEASSSNEPQRL